MPSIYHKYAGQTNRQPCHLELNLETGHTMCDWDPELGHGVPEAVYHGRILRWRIGCLTEEAQEALLERVQPLADTIVNGTAIEWDGHNNRGIMSDAAETAADAIESICQEEWPEEQHWDAADWLATDLPIIEASATDEDLEDLADNLERDALDDGMHIHGTLAALQYLRQLARNDQERETIQRIDDRYRTNVR